MRRLTNSLQRARDTLVGKERDPNVTTGMTLFADKLLIHVACRAWPRGFWNVTRKQVVKECRGMGKWKPSGYGKEVTCSGYVL